MLYSKETKKVRREAYNIITAFNRNLAKVKATPTGRTMLNGKPKAVIINN
jgi:hypothetical protein